MTLPLLLAFLQGPLFQLLVALPLILIGADVLSGSASALKRGVFAWSKLSQFLDHDLATYAASCLLLLLAYLVTTSTLAASLGAVIGMPALSIRIALSIAANLSEVFGAPVPVALVEEGVREAAGRLSTAIAPTATVTTTATPPSIDLTWPPKLPV